MPGVKLTFPMRLGKMAYLFVLVAAGGGFVPAGVVDVVVSPLPQPVSTAPANRLISTKRIYILFISG